MKLARLAAAVLIAAAPCAALADFGVSPLRIELEPGVKSAVVTVTGKTAPGRALQVTAMRWTQDAEGRDVYEDTGDLVFYPKTVDLSKNGRQLVRVGVEKTVADVEQSYRLFIREPPPPENPGEMRAQVAVVVDFALPILVRPAKVVRSVEIRDAYVDKGVLKVKVVNTGNVRLILQSLSAGKAEFADFNSWYLLAGASRRFETKLPREACRQPIAVLLRTGTLNVKRDVTVMPDSCG